MEGMKIKDLMAVDVVTLDPDASLEEAAAVMDAAGTGVLPVVENGRVTGVVTDRDIVVRALAKGLSPDETAIGDIMTYELVSCAEDDDTQVAEELMARHGVRRVVVVDGQGCLKGLVSRGWLSTRAPRAAALLEEASRPLSYASH
jgi:CBS domain-containing protein